MPSISKNNAQPWAFLKYKFNFIKYNLNLYKHNLYFIKHKLYFNGRGDNNLFRAFTKTLPFICLPLKKAQKNTALAYSP